MFEGIKITKNEKLKEKEQEQRERLNTRFAGREVSQPSADSDIIAANDIEDETKD
jgi:hypothetical protein